MVLSKKPAPPKPVEFTEPVEVPEVTEPAFEPEVETEEVPERKKPGRKVSPLTVAIREWEHAKHKTEVAQKKFDKVKDLQVNLEAARATEQAAYENLQKVLSEQGMT